MLVLAAYGSMLVAEIRVCGSMEMGLDACGLTEMGFNACGSVLAMEIGACESMKSMLMGQQRSVLVGFDSCVVEIDACGEELI